MESTNKQVEQVDLIRQHYKRRFGDPVREAEFLAKTGERVEIWKWSESSSREGVCIYATIGASLQLVVGERRCEFFLGISPEADDVVEALAEIALHGTGLESVPDFGDTVTLTWGLWRGTGMSSFLITDGGDEIIQPLKKANGNIEFLQLVPLFPSECTYKKTHGEDALWKLFEENQVPYWDSKRACAINSLQ